MKMFLMKMIWPSSDHKLHHSAQLLYRRSTDGATEFLSNLMALIPASTLQQFDDMSCFKWHAILIICAQQVSTSIVCTTDKK